jgi:mono/diheme cytochrome c family protein
LAGKFLETFYSSAGFWRLTHHTMNKILLRGSGPLLLLVFIAPTVARATESDSGLIDRGRYLVHEVAMCIDCHSPRGEKGGFLEGRHLTGATLDFAATVPMPWAPFAPKIAGLENFTAEEAVRFFMTGTRPSGAPTLPPMPGYRMNQEDAAAVTAYLKSLAPQ